MPHQNPHLPPPTKLKRYLPYLITAVETGRLKEKEEELYTHIITEAVEYMNRPEHSGRYARVIGYAAKMRERMMMSASGLQAMAEAAAFGKAALAELNEIPE